MIGRHVFRIYYRILYSLWTLPPIWYLMCIEAVVKSELPGAYHYTDIYYNRVEYLRRRKEGENVTFEQVEQEYFEKFRKLYQEFKNK